MTNIQIMKTMSTQNNDQCAGGYITTNSIVMAHVIDVVHVVDALVPLAEMFQYVSTLRGMTKGRASYSMQLANFDVEIQLFYSNSPIIMIRSCNIFYRNAVKVTFSLSRASSAGSRKSKRETKDLLRGEGKIKSASNN
ncbi:hypothetical protein M5K25_026387 [Dendrobium thyrsiflorum]|uniref:Elongation factor EFG domain-containing protein n=1 Tax=Dendrobium thyrsiflorum TaxID=117978 RepID=A0ABD0TX51_DENTH